MMHRGHQIRAAVPKVPVEPPRGVIRARISAATFGEAYDPSLPSTSPRLRIRLERSIAMLALLLVRSPRARLVKPTVEARWEPHNHGGGSASSEIVDLSAVATDRLRATTGERAGSVDRICAVVMTITAASLAIAVAFVVAPRLRDANFPAYPETSALVTLGGEVYGTACAACHGPALKGDAAQASGLVPPPLDASGHAWLHSDATLFRMVKYGIANCLAKGTQSQMPSFGDRLDDRSIHAVLAFIKSQWPANLRIVQNAFNDGESDAADTQERALCSSICGSAASNAAAPGKSNVVGQ